MISLLVIRDKTVEDRLYSTAGLTKNSCSKSLGAFFGDDLLGYSLFDLDGKTITVRFLEPLSDIPLADGILRSTLHIAAERSVMDAFYAETLPEEFVEKIGFLKDRAEKRLDIDKLFQSCCGCK